MSGDGMRKKRHKHKHPEEPNIVPLIDITANLLFFLMVGMDLKEKAETADKIELPASTSRHQDETPMVKLTLNAESLMLEGLKQATLKDGKFQPADIDKGRLTRLTAELEKRRKAFEASGLDLSEEKNRPVVYFMADRNLEYESVELVMRSAGQAGFPRFRFAVMMR
ncbi:MAG: biopolymer transporter ExbD [Myxococcota bacterium]